MMDAGIRLKYLDQAIDSLKNVSCKERIPSVAILEK